jgi:hypothetical protein
MRYLITRGARAGIYIPHLGSLLHIACLQEKHVDNKIYLEMVQILADAGADLNAPGPLPAGEPLLYTIISSEKSYLTHHHSVFRYLVSDLRVDVNKPTNSGETPIIALARHSNLKKLRYLIHHGGNINAADNEGRRAIHYFSANAEPYIEYKNIRYFAKAGADLYTPDNYGRTPLHIAVGGRDPVECARVILKASTQSFNIYIKDMDGWTPLMYVCRSEMADANMLDLLVKEYGADVWPVSYDGQWSARKLVNLVDISDYDYPLELLEPPEDKRERIGPDGVKQTWDPAFHTTTPEDYINTRCDSCLLVSLQPLSFHIVTNTSRIYSRVLASGIGVETVLKLSGSASSASRIETRCTKQVTPSNYAPFLSSQRTSEASTAARIARRRMVTNPMRLGRAPDLLGPRRPTLKPATMTMMMTRLKAAVIVHSKAFEVGLWLSLQLLVNFTSRAGLKQGEPTVCMYDHAYVQNFMRRKNGFPRLFQLL